MRKEMPRAIRCSIGLFAIMLTHETARAQVLYGSLTGNVSDPSSAAIPNAKVEVLNTGTGIAKQTTTDNRGVYLYTDLQPGTYKITVSAPSFRTTIEENLNIVVNTVRRADFHLQIAQAAETIEVNAATTVLQTDRADVRAEISQQ